MAVVSIGSGLDFTVYADVDTANDFLAGQFDATAWRATDETSKARALVSATRYIDAQQWLGEKTDEAQELDFPRTGLTYRDGTEVPSDAVPQEVTDSCCLLAASIVDGTAAGNAATVAAGTRRLKAGSAEIEYFRPIVGAGTPVFPRYVMLLIGQWLSGSSPTYAGSDASGVDTLSRFRRGYGTRPY